MISINNQKNAYKEVYVILQNLEQKEYSKIPEVVIKVIKENKNDDYKFYLNENLELKQHKLLPETRAILFNLFRDYLSKPWQKEKIIKWQNQERIKNDAIKREKYSVDVFKNENRKYNNLKEIKNEEIIENNRSILKNAFSILKEVILK